MQQSLVTPYRAYYYRLTRFNPIRSLTPEILSQHLDDFDRGFLRNLAIDMDAIARRDDLLKCVIPKRFGALQRREWEIFIPPENEGPEADRHKEALAYFYNNLTATDAVDLNVKGGFGMMVKQMLRAQLYGYAVHELIWDNQADGLTARVNYVPLWFFENRSGKLRFLLTDFSIIGEDMEEGAWMVTCGERLMEPCCVAWQYKHLCLRDWLIYSEKHAMPGILGKTTSVLGTPQHDNLVAAVQQIALDYSAVIGKDDELAKIDFSADGNLPYQPLVERMDRAMAAIMRGADLSTISAGSGTGQGASLQGLEAHIIEVGDAVLISETLNLCLDKLIIQNKFGEGVRPLAFVKIIVPPYTDTTKDIAVDTFLLGSGAKLGVASAMERYGRDVPGEDEEVLTAPMPAVPAAAGEESDASAPEEEETGNEILKEARKLHEKVQPRFAKATAETLGPVRDALGLALDAPNESEFRANLFRLEKDLPGLMKAVNKRPKNGEMLHAALSSAFINGAAAKRKR